MGTQEQDYRTFSQSIESTTGGLGAGVGVRGDPYGMSRSSFWLYSLSIDIEKFSKVISLSSFCLNRNLGNMFDLWRQIFEAGPNFSDKERLSVLIDQIMTGFQENLVDSGHRYASMHASASLLERSVRNL